MHVNDLLERMDYTPNDPHDQKMILKELRLEKKESTIPDSSTEFITFAHLQGLRRGPLSMIQERSTRIWHGQRESNGPMSRSGG
jgi:hypothetical protein